ncbi:heavy metal translocating P-type ATPase [Actinomadura scrupuli]|uniref:heavy metal translocating P-type ATPase n=1 Tax=Actinomadura scrupuli TaxID=559629 RepID=UPI003D99E795
MDTPRSRLSGILFALAAMGLLAGVGAWAVGAPAVAAVLWVAVTATACVPALWWVIDGLRHHRFGSDVIAVLALAGTLAVREYPAGAIIAVMVTGGRLLEDRAGRRARRDLSALLSVAPRLTHRRQDNDLVTVDVDEVRPGDLLLVRPGEVVPVDGLVAAGTALLDESTLTGEAIPVERPPGEEVRSGAVSSGSPFDLRATADARSSTYAGIVGLAREAAASSSPFVRMADRYAALFLPATLVLAALAWWLAADPVRAVAVLVVATPCPLILAAPVAFVSGLSRCARRGVVVKGGGALERLAQARVLLFDKTGTVTAGRPVVADVLVRDDAGEPVPAREVLRLAACLDQVSPHVLASAIVRRARSGDLPLVTPVDVREEPGQGVRGMVGDRVVSVGKAVWAAPPPADVSWAATVRKRAAARGMVTVFAGIDGQLAGALLLEDRIRPDAARTFRLVRRAGITRAVMITGDRAAIAESIAALVGADEVHAEQSPAGKVAVVRAESARAATVMAGDGVNDAPALAAAGVGVAMGARGATASSEAADVVITVDRLERLAESLAIARRTRSIALQSVLAGMGLSFAAMLVAAAGYLPPAPGALLQEAIDVAVILNALRALGPGRDRWPRLRGDAAELVRRLDEDHRRLRPQITELSRLAELPDTELLAAGPALTAFLTGDLAAHEQADERLLYPVVADVLGGADPTGPMSRGHAEIAERTRRIVLLCAEARDDPRALRELRRALHELHAILRLHFAQEEENFYVLADEPDGSKDPSRRP